MPSHTSKKKPIILLSCLLFLAVLAAGGYITYPSWNQWIMRSDSNTRKDESLAIPLDEPTTVKMTEQACSNLGLCTGEVKLQSYWKKIQTTGIIADRPGFTDRGVTSPVDSVVAKVHALEGETVRPGDKLFTLRIVSEYLQQAQSDYFKAINEIKLLNTEIVRIRKLTNSGVIPEKRLIILNQEVSRQELQVNAHRQELLSRGFVDKQLEKIAAGDFIKTIEVFAPHVAKSELQVPNSKITQIGFDTDARSSSTKRDTFLEVQELKVQLGQQIKAGELLTVLANHHYLYINGHAFKKEAANIARAAEENWDVEVEFLEDAAANWPAIGQSLRIRHLSNTIDPQSRTFEFCIPLNNQSRSYQRDGDTFVVWRFRPGQRVRIHVPVAKMTDVIVVPSEAVINDGPDSYVFQQNGDYYERIPVHVLHRDRLKTVIANDGSVLPGFFLAQNSAASLNRILKVQTASGENTGNFHVHADGSVHANH